MNGSMSMDTIGPSLIRFLASFVKGTEMRETAALAENHTGLVEKNRTVAAIKF